MSGLSPRTMAALDQAHAHTSLTVDQMVATAREMSADGMDPADRVALVTLALWDVLAKQPVELAGLAATAILRLAYQPTGGVR